MINSKLLHFHVLRQIGAGAMGVVYEAMDTKLERKVALKFLLEHTRLDSATQARFTQEAKVVSKFDHPNIGVLYSLEETDRQAFLVMALYQGETLAERITHTELDFKTIVQFALEMAYALDHAHTKGVMHRDLKPANVFIAKDASGAERIKVLDFGLAKLEEQSQFLTKANAMVGTLLYASPEQLRGQFVIQSDLWAWGCVVYQMLTQIAPFSGDTIGHVLNNIISKNPEPLEQLRPETPDDLLYLVSQCLEKDPNDRIQNAKELIAILEQTAFDLKSATAEATPTATYPIVSTLAFSKPKLPLSNTVFVGRESELEQINQLLELPQVKLVTLLGLGGMGKTRLALEVATKRQTQYRDGVAFVDLTRVDNANLVPIAILNALELNVNQDATEDALSALEFREMLLVLDNFEHLMDAKNFLVRLLEVARKTQVLVTTREALGLQTEQLLEIGGFPALTDAPLETQSAAKLFYQAAQKVQFEFAFKLTDHAPFKRIYNALSGSPLGLSLAATWTRMLELPEIADEIEQNLTILETTAPDLPERQRSFSAVFESSWRYLNQTEQSVLAKLTVFRGGFTKEWAKRVAGANLLVLQSLIQKCLISRKNNRYAIHELIKQFAEKELSAAARDEAMSALSQCCLELSEIYEQYCRTAKQIELSQQVTLELENLRAALNWLVDHDAGLGGFITLNLGLYWTLRGLEIERNNLIHIFYNKHRKKDRNRVKILKFLAQYYYNEMDIETAENHLEEARRIVAEFSLIEEEAELDLIGSFNERNKKNFAKAEQLVLKALAVFQSENNFGKIAFSYLALAAVYADNREVAFEFEKIFNLYQKSIEFARLAKEEFNIPVAILNMSALAARNKDFELEKLLAKESLALFRSLHNYQGIVNSSNRLGFSYLASQMYSTAAKYFLEALSISFELNYKSPVNIGIDRISNVLYATQYFKDGFVLSAISATIYDQMYPNENVKEKWRMGAHQKLLEQGFTQEYITQLEAEATVMTLEEAVHFAVETLQRLMPELEALEKNQIQNSSITA